MNSTVRRLAAHPAPTAEDLERIAPPEHRAATLARILADDVAPHGRPNTAPSAPRPRGRRVPVLAGATVALAAAVAVAVAVLPAPGPEPFTTPALLTYTPTEMGNDPMSVLDQLAERAAAQPPSGEAGRFAYVRTRGWYFDVVVTDAGATARVNPTEREQWTAADGEGRIEETRSGERTRTSGRYGGRELSSVQPLPTDPAALAAAIRPVDDQPAAWMDAVASELLRRPVPPAVQSALLQVLARQRGLAVAGKVTDRAGRAGVALSAVSRDGGQTTKHILILDPATGAPLAQERVQLTGDLRTFVELPATESYTLWLDTGWVDSVDERP